MFKKNLLLYPLLLLLTLCMNAAYAEEILVRLPSGESVTIFVTPETSIRDLQDLIDQIEKEIEDATSAVDPSFEYGMTGSENGYLLDFSRNQPNVALGFLSHRDYFKHVTKDQKDDMRYIVTTLGKASWTELWSESSKLDKAGGRVALVHPLRFLLCIFTDEEMKAGIHAMRNRGKVWPEFASEMFESLQAEANVNNVTEKMVKHFAETTQINAALIWPLVQAHDWAKFVDKLLEIIPRSGNPGHYDM